MHTFEILLNLEYQSLTLNDHILHYSPGLSNVLEFGLFPIHSNHSRSVLCGALLWLFISSNSQQGVGRFLMPACLGQIIKP